MRHSVAGPATSEELDRVPEERHAALPQRDHVVGAQHPLRHAVRGQGVGPRPPRQIRPRRREGHPQSHRQPDLLPLHQSYHRYLSSFPYCLIPLAYLSS